MRQTKVKACLPSTTKTWNNIALHYTEQGSWMILTFLWHQSSFSCCKNKPVHNIMQFCCMFWSHCVNATWIAIVYKISCRLNVVNLSSITLNRKNVFNRKCDQTSAFYLWKACAYKKSYTYFHMQSFRVNTI